MREDYEQEFLYINSRINELKGNLVEESTLVAKFKFTNEWHLVLAGERYASGTFLYLIEPLQARRFDIWLLMKAFAAATGKSCPPLFLENQINFLKIEYNEIFENIEHYSKEYDKLNKIF